MKGRVYIADCGSMAYLVRKLLHSLLLFFVVSLLVFTLLAITPGDFFSELQMNPALSAASIERMRVQQELDRPLPLRYWHWLQAVVRGDWGESLAYEVPVWPLLRVRALNTLLLTTVAAVVAWVAALVLGIWSALRIDGVVDRLVMFGTSVFLGVPDILVGLALLIFAVRTHWVPAGGMSSLDHDSLSRFGRLQDTLQHLFLPVGALMIAALPTLTRHVRTGMIDALQAPSVRTVRAAGVGSVRIVMRHVLPLASSPLISLLGLSIAALLSGSLLVEWIMSWPGLGPLLLEAIFARDVYVVIGAVMLSTALLVIGNFLADILLVANDPRLREARL